MVRWERNRVIASAKSAVAIDSWIALYGGVHTMTYSLVDKTVVYDVPNLHEGGLYERSKFFSFFTTRFGS